jgi:hypothetical protein
MSFRDKARQRLQDRRQAGQPADGPDEQAPSPDEPKATSDQPSESAPAEADYTAELEQLAKLKAEGVLTDDEFAAKKKQILGI